MGRAPWEGKGADSTPGVCHPVPAPQSTKAVYDRILDLRIATPQIVINYAMFLEEHKYFEESFKVRRSPPRCLGNCSCAQAAPTRYPPIGQLNPQRCLLMEARSLRSRCGQVCFPPRLPPPRPPPPLACREVSCLWCSGVAASAVMRMSVVLERGHLSHHILIQVTSCKVFFPKRNLVLRYWELGFRLEFEGTQGHGSACDRRRVWPVCVCVVGCPCPAARVMGCVHVKGFPYVCVHSEGLCHTL